MASPHRDRPGAAHREAVERLLRAREPSLRWKTRVSVLGESEDSSGVRALSEEVRRSARARRLLAHVRTLGRPGTLRRVYYKWQGCHWVLANLADLGYPRDDPDLYPARDRVLDLWLRSSYYHEYDTQGPIRVGRFGVPRVRGRFRRCASQQGNALYYLTRLGLDDGRCADLSERLHHWQWPDGGWNCDRNPAADTSSFLETLLPMMGLAARAEVTGSPADRRAADAASEVFLRRKLFRRISDDRVIHPRFVRLHYPAYYFYDILAGLRGMVAVGRIRDPRCSEALDLLESRRRPDGGWSADEALYRYSPGAFVSRGESVDWGGAGGARSNPWVTVDALSVLAAAGRFSP